MSSSPTSSPPDLVLVDLREWGILALGLVYITTVILVREFLPEEHDIWLIVTELITRTVAVFFPMIDGHADAYRGLLTDTRVDELRGIYAANRLFALLLVGVAINRVYRTAPQFDWYAWNGLGGKAKWIFWLAVVGCLATPLVLTGLVFGFTDQSFFDFAFGVNLVEHDIYYYLDFLLFLAITWQFVLFFPATAYFTGKAGYGHWFSARLRARRRSAE